MHTSCVNSITFSNDGQWLASAGDGVYLNIHVYSHRMKI